MNIRKITEQANQVSELNDINVTEATSMKDMGFKPWNHKTPSFRIGRLEGVSADQLTKMFGPPKKGSGDGKSTMEWGFSNPQGLVFTVYDYRNPPASKSAPHNWSVGGVNKAHAASVQRAFKMMGVPGKMIKEETDPFMVGQTVSEWRDADTGDVMEGVSVMSGAEGMIKNDPAGGASMVSSFRKTKAALASKPAGSVLLLTKEKDPESMTLKIYEPKDFDSLMRGLSKKPEKKVGSKGSWSGGEVTVLGLKEEVEVTEQFKAGDKVKVPHKGKMVSGKIVRYDDGGTDKARQHGGGYVVDVGEPASVLVPKQKVQKEEVEIEENYKDTLKGVRNIKVVKPVDFAKNLTVGSTWTLMYDTSYMGDPMYRLYNSNAPSGKKMSGRISGKKIAKALEGGMLVKESMEMEGEDLQEGKIKFSRILQGVKDMQGPFTIVVMKPTGPGALMQKKVPGRDALPAHINHMLANDLKGKAWKAIAIEGSSGGVLNVLFPKDVTKAESVEEDTEVISESMAATLIGGALAAALAGGFSFAALNFLFDNAFTPSSIKQEWNIFVRRWKDKSAGGKMTGDQGAAMAKELRGLIAKLPKKNQAYLSGIVTRMQNSLKPNKDGKVDKEAAGKFLRAAKEKIGKTKMESVEMDEGFAQPTQKELQKSIKWLEGLLKDPAKMKKSGLDLQDVKDNLRAAKDFLDFGKKHASKINKEEVEVDEASWGGGFQSSREAQAGVQASAKADAKRERTVLFSSIRAVMSGKMSKAEFKKKIGQSFDKISPLAKQKAMKVKEEVVDENTYTTAMGTKVTHIDYGQMAAEEAKKIKERAKQLGVQVLVQSSTSIAFVKSFTKGSMQEFFKAYRDCDRIRSMVKFKGNQNEWGCSTAGVGIGAQECVKSGKVMIYKSGSGAAGLLRKLEESLSDDEMLSRIDEAFGDLA